MWQQQSTYRPAAKSSLLTNHHVVAFQFSHIDAFDGGGKLSSSSSSSGSRVPSHTMDSRELLRLVTQMIALSVERLHADFCALAYLNSTLLRQEGSASSLVAHLNSAVLREDDLVLLLEHYIEGGWRCALSPHDSRLLQPSLSPVAVASKFETLLRRGGTAAAVTVLELKEFEADLAANGSSTTHTSAAALTTQRRRSSVVATAGGGGGARRRRSSVAFLPTDGAPVEMSPPPMDFGGSGAFRPMDEEGGGEDDDDGAFPFGARSDAMDHPDNNGPLAFGVDDSGEEDRCPFGVVAADDEAEQVTEALWPWRALMALRPRQRRAMLSRIYTAIDSNDTGSVSWSRLSNFLADSVLRDGDGKGGPTSFSSPGSSPRSGGSTSSGRGGLNDGLRSFVLSQEIIDRQDYGILNARGVLLNHSSYSSNSSDQRPDGLWLIQSRIPSTTSNVPRSSHEALAAGSRVEIHLTKNSGGNLLPIAAEAIQIPIVENITQLEWVPSLGSASSSSSSTGNASGGAEDDVGRSGDEGEEEDEGGSSSSGCIVYSSTDLRLRVLQVKLNSRSVQPIGPPIYAGDTYNNLTWSPYWNLLCCTSSAGTMALWKPRPAVASVFTGGVQHPLFEKTAQYRHHTSSISKVLFLPFDGTLVSASLDPKIVLQDVEAGAVLGELRGLQGGIRDAAYHADYHAVIAGGYSPEIRLWTLHNSTRGAPMILSDAALEHHVPVVGVHAVQHTTNVLSVDCTGLIKVWDLRMMKAAEHLRIDVKGLEAASGGRGDRSVQQMISMGDGDFLIASRRYSAYLHKTRMQSSEESDSAASRARRRLSTVLVQRSTSTDGGQAVSSDAPPPYVVSMEYSNLLNAIVVAMSTGEVTTWTPRRDEEAIMSNSWWAWDQDGARDSLSAMALDATGKKALIGFRSGCVRMFNVSSGMLMKCVQVGDKVGAGHSGGRPSSRPGRLPTATGIGRDVIDIRCIVSAVFILVRGDGSAFQFVDEKGGKGEGGDGGGGGGDVDDPTRRFVPSTQFEFCGYQGHPAQFVVCTSPSKWEAQQAAVSSDTKRRSAVRLVMDQSTRAPVGPTSVQFCVAHTGGVLTCYSVTPAAGGSAALPQLQNTISLFTERPSLRLGGGASMMTSSSAAGERHSISLTVPTTTTAVDILRTSAPPLEGDDNKTTKTTVPPWTATRRGAYDAQSSEAGAVSAIQQGREANLLNEAATTDLISFAVICSESDVPQFAVIGDTEGILYFVQLEQEKEEAPGPATTSSANQNNKRRNVPQLFATLQLTVPPDDPSASETMNLSKGEGPSSSNNKARGLAFLPVAVEVLSSFHIPADPRAIMASPSLRLHSSDSSSSDDDSDRPTKTTKTNSAPPMTTRVVVLSVVDRNATNIMVHLHFPYQRDAFVTAVEATNNNSGVTPSPSSSSFGWYRPPPSFLVKGSFFCPSPDGSLSATQHPHSVYVLRGQTTLHPLAAAANRSAKSPLRWFSVPAVHHHDHEPSSPAEQVEVVWILTKPREAPRGRTIGQGNVNNHNAKRRLLTPNSRSPFLSAVSSVTSPSLEPPIDGCFLLPTSATAMGAGRLSPHHNSSNPPTQQQDHLNHRNNNNNNHNAAVVLSPPTTGMLLLPIPLPPSASPLLGEGDDDASELPSSTTLMAGAGEGKGMMIRRPQHRHAVKLPGAAPLMGMKDPTASQQRTTKQSPSHDARLRKGADEGPSQRAGAGGGGATLAVGNVAPHNGTKTAVGPLYSRRLPPPGAEPSVWQSTTAHGILPSAASLTTPSRTMTNRHPSAVVRDVVVEHERLRRSILCEEERLFTPPIEREGGVDGQLSNTTTHAMSLTQRASTPQPHSRPRDDLLLAHHQNHVPEEQTGNLPVRAFCGLRTSSLTTVGWRTPSPTGMATTVPAPSDRLRPLPHRTTAVHHHHHHHQNETSASAHHPAVLDVPPRAPYRGAAVTSSAARRLTVQGSRTTTKAFTSSNHHHNNNKRSSTAQVSSSQWESLNYSEQVSLLLQQEEEEGER